MRLTMKERQAVVKKMAIRYRMAGKKEKGKMVQDLVALTEYHRTYAAFLLKNQGRRIHGRNPSVRLVGDVAVARLRNYPRRYDAKVVAALKEIWLMMDGICGKRLAAAIPAVLPILEKHQEIHLDRETRANVLRISAATIDRLLAHERKKLSLKGRSFTKPGTLLKHQIPIRTFADWTEKKPGFVEIDLVAHEGGNSHGDFCQTLDVTDVQTTWTETEAVKNKAQVWVFAALKHIRNQLPFPLRGIDSDGGGEFINDQLARYCIQEKITFTRGRAGKKNDGCYVEQKNYSIVRRTVGYFRYDTEEELLLLNEIYRQLRLYTNFFLPTMKLLKKTRVGSKVKKQYDIPKTPYQRVLQSPDVPKANKDRLKRQYASLNPAQLKREMTILQNRLFEWAQKKSVHPENETNAVQSKKEDLNLKR